MAGAPKVINGGVNFYRQFFGFLPLKMAIYRFIEVGVKCAPIYFVFIAAGMRF